MKIHNILFILFILFILGCNNKKDSKNFISSKKNEKMEFTGEIKIITCKNFKNNSPEKITKTFSIYDTVYFVAYWKKIYGNHKTTAVFIDPSNTTRFPTEVYIKNANGECISWYWFKLNNNNKSNIEKGKWILKLYFDNKLAKTSEIFISD